jgi:hypothetical protein
VRALPAWIHAPGLPPVGSCLAAQLRGLPLERLVGFPFTGALEDSGDFGQQIGAPRRELAELGHHGGFVGVGELPPPGVTSSCARELGDRDPVRPRAILVHRNIIESEYDKKNYRA